MRPAASPSSCIPWTLRPSPNVSGGPTASCCPAAGTWPHWSGQSAHATQYDVDDAQDAFDLALARIALREGWPLLAVCRGLQVVNVALGGDLLPDLPGHRHLVHPVRGAYSLTVSCYHHQGLGRLGEGLRPVAWAEDGTVEAAVMDGAPGWFLGVQWHPEDTAATDPAQAGIVQTFVDAARR